jgi:anti-sigma B factor antagonist
MDMSVEDEEGLTRIVLVGKLDLKGADEIDLRFSAIAGKRPRVAVDLSGVDYMASMGVRILVMSGKVSAQRGNKIVLFGACEPVGKVISTSGLDQIIPVAEDWASARTLLA